MKKNLRIVSVAASAVSTVNAETPAAATTATNTAAANNNVSLNLNGAGDTANNAANTVKVAKDATLNGKTGDVQATLNQYGNATGLTYTQTLHAYNQSVTNAVYFINVNSDTTETKGTWMTFANNGKLNVSSVLDSLTKQYNAVQYSNNAFNKIGITTTAADVTSELKKAGVDVDASDNFTAPDTFTVTLNAKSDVNGKTASLPVVVTVPNGKSTVVPNVSKTIMHNAYFYDKNAKRVGTDKLTRYNSVTVSPKTTTISGVAYYEVVENGKLSGKFINADNIDGTKRTLKHNAYVYKTSKKCANKVTLKKGTEVTTYGGAYTFKNGKQYYKIGNNTDKTYVKASNF